MVERKVPSDERIKELYLDELKSSGNIAEKYNVTRHTVCKHLRRLGITRPKSGPNSRNRKFRKKQHKNGQYGYPLTFRPDHPKANSKGYVKDHFLVVEKKYGRLPKDDEVVHHIDFNPQNNDPENLVLMSNGEHLKVHASFRNLARKLFELGVIEFDERGYKISERLIE